MLPSSVGMIPVEIDHVVRFVVEGFVPETLDEIVVDEPLDIMASGRNSEDRYRLFERDRGVQPRQLTAKLGEAFASLVASLQIELSEVLADMGIAELTRRAHLLVDIEEKLAARRHFAV